MKETTKAMEFIKERINLEFDVKYADGSRKEVKEGVLFEFDGNAITLHLGTRRKEALFSIAEALTDAICEMGLGHEFEQYLEEMERKAE